MCMYVYYLFWKGEADEEEAAEESVSARLDVRCTVGWREEGEQKG